MVTGLTPKDMALASVPFTFLLKGAFALLRDITPVRCKHGPPDSSALYQNDMLTGEHRRRTRARASASDSFTHPRTDLEEARGQKNGQLRLR